MAADASLGVCQTADTCLAARGNRSEGTLTRFVVILVAAAAAVLYGSASARAEVVSNQSEPLDFSSFVGCAAGGVGETVHLTGSLHVASTVTTDASGGLHLTTHFNPQGVTGVGLTTGAKYQGTGVTLSNFNLGAGLQVTQVNNFRLIGMGGAPNLSVHAVTVFTANANGVVTASFDKLSVTCS